MATIHETCFGVIGTMKVLVCSASELMPRSSSLSLSARFDYDVLDSGRTDCKGNTFLEYPFQDLHRRLKYPSHRWQPEEPRQQAYDTTASLCPSRYCMRLEPRALGNYTQPRKPGYVTLSVSECENKARTRTQWN